jgi:hypothetical protein
MTIPQSPPWINEAMKLTTQTIDIRASRFRYYVISVVIVVLVSTMLTVLQMSWRPLLGFLLLVPLCNTFLYLDNRLVYQWQQQILEQWSQGHLDLTLFVKAITSLSILPSRTLHGMLTLLPDVIYATATIAPGTRKALAMTLQSINRYQNDRIVFTTLANTLGLISLGFAAFQWSAMPLLGLLFMPLSLSLHKWAMVVRFRRWRRHIIAMQHRQELMLQSLVAVASQLDWNPMPDTQKKKLLNSLTTAA